MQQHGLHGLHGSAGSEFVVEAVLDGWPDGGPDLTVDRSPHSKGEVGPSKAQAAWQAGGRPWVAWRFVEKK